MARNVSRIMLRPFPWLRVYALRVLLALSIQRGLRTMRSDFLLAFFQRVPFPLLVSPYSLSCSWFGLVWLALNIVDVIAEGFLASSKRVLHEPLSVNR
jgi:hypothetical protein